MGNSAGSMFKCSCIEQAYKHLGSNDEAKAAKDRTELLQRYKHDLLY
jgi:hypothetical protein